MQRYQISGCNSNLHNTYNSVVRTPVPVVSLMGGRGAFENKFYNNWAISRALIGLRESYGLLEYRPWKIFVDLLSFVLFINFHPSRAIRERNKRHKRQKKSQLKCINIP